MLGNKPASHFSTDNKAIVRKGKIVLWPLQYPSIARKQ